MQYKLRDYQQDLIDKIFKKWAEGDRAVMVQLATAGGKTLIFSHIAKSFVQQGDGVLVIAHRKELILQAREKLESVSGLECGVIKAGFPQEEFKDIQVASIQSLSRRKFRPEVGLIICDEAHRTASKSWTDLLDEYPDAYVLGMTATPHRADGQGFQDHFDSLVVGISPRELIEKGYLSKFKLFGARPIDTSGIKTVKGDFDAGELEERAMSIISDIVPEYEKRAKDKKTIVFAVGCDHSKQIRNAYLEAGYTCEHLDGKTADREREAIIDRFRNGETQILTNVGVFTEGFDVPGVEAIQVVRPTRSLVLYLQMLGRGLRPAEGKEHCIFIDHSDNWMAHGLPDEDREWSLAPISLQKSRFTQQCPECEHVFMPLSHEQSHPVRVFEGDKGQQQSEHESACPACGHKFLWTMGMGGVAQNSREAKQDHGSITEVDVNTTEFGMELIKNAIQIQQSTGKKKGWIYFQLMRNPEVYRLSLGDWRYLCGYLRYRPNWAIKSYSEAQVTQMSLDLGI